MSEKLIYVRFPWGNYRAKAALMLQRVMRGELGGGKVVGTSYVSERSVEYALVGRMSAILRQRYKHVVPLYPWAKREGSNLSKQIHAEHYFRVLAVYPRRPKMVAADSAGIAFTFNAAIGMGAKKALAEGIPSVGGCPVARSFFELASCNQFIWVNVSERQSLDVTRRIELNQRGEILNNNAPNVFSDDEILHLIETESRWISIQQFMEAVKQIKAAGSPESFLGPFRMFGGYKPIYFLLA